MTLPPKDYLRARRKEISAQIQTLNEELRDLDRMESALTGQPLLGVIPAAPRVFTEEVVDQRKRRRFEGGIKGMILFVLAHEGTALQALTILKRIKHFFGAELERTSLSPQLSRLKDDSFVTLIDDGWLITPLGVDFLNGLEMKPPTPGRE